MSNWMAVLLRQIITQMTPTIRKTVVEFVNKLESDVKATENPWDDIAVGLLKLVLLIK